MSDFLGGCRMEGDDESGIPPSSSQEARLEAFANMSMMSTLFLNMSTQAQAQHCKEYMRLVCINTQTTSVFPKRIV
ncbi:uncharacterized protein EAF01_010387 [Botrytis porri]|uniref:uncharacterized protein n=1 Tax=Botrytis porri TaxID=87229 RepID=UPI0018FF3257|nr:uncharacterized protein EAF01_010387 [Botrytis porri]KAF7892307.1 hypothetical protein EAF01_010387 [Botrytis porri]